MECFNDYFRSYNIVLLLRCWVAGWGKNAFGVTGQYQAVLKAVDVPVLNAGSCETSLRATRLGTAYILDRAAFICAGGELNKDACTVKEIFVFWNVF